MPTIATLPSELIEEILSHSELNDLGSMSQAATIFNRLINHAPDSHLWRRLYLSQPLDDPRQCYSTTGQPPSTDIIWREELQRLAKSWNLISVIERLSLQERIEVSRTLINLAYHVPLLSLGPRRGTSKNLLYVAAMLRGGAFFDSAPDTRSIRLADLTDEMKLELQLRSQLHTLYGVTPKDATIRAQAASRGIVYSMRNYTFDNSFGPFLPSEPTNIEEGEEAIKVNWVHLQAIHHVVSLHIVDMPQEEDGFEFVIYPLSLPFTQIREPVVRRGNNDDEQEDWAGVGGRWKCSFCFMDHRELLRYNNLRAPSTTPLDTSIFTEPTFHEVFRTIEVDLTVIKRTDSLDRERELIDMELDDTSTNSVYSLFTDPLPSVRLLSPPRQPGRRRKIHFAGVVNGTSTMVGWVGMTAEGNVRWHFTSGEQGNAIWSSEGVQLGGLRSQTGVLGSWTTIFHDEDDPVGPFWLRKMEEGEPTSIE